VPAWAPDYAKVQDQGRIAGGAAAGDAQSEQSDADPGRSEPEQSRNRVARALWTALGVITFGLGTVGRNLLNLLRPFACRVHVYDPYLKEDALDQWEFARLASFEEAMSQPVVSVHAAQTPETYHIINEKALSMLPDGGLLVNSSRGSLVDTQALIAALQTGRIRAVLDVFEQEGQGNQPEELLKLDNVILQPHMAASAVSWQMTDAIVDEIERFLRGEAPELSVSLGQYRLMTQE